jgi:hypothetical protein
MPLSCYLCPRECCSIDEYTGHLRQRHALIEPCKLMCNVDGCIRTFASYRSLRKHMRKSHDVFLQSLVPCDVRCDESPSSCVSASANSEMPSGCCNNDIVIDSPSVDSSGLCVAAIKFLSSLMASNSVTLSTVSFVRDSTAELVKEIVEYLKAKTMQTMQKLGHNVSDMKELLDQFECWKEPFLGIDSQFKLLSYMKNIGSYIPPVSKTMGSRWDVRYDRRSKERHQVQVEDKFYYIPIENTLKLVLQHPESQKLIRVQEKADTETLEDWLDGENGQQLQQYCKEKFPASLPIFIQVYFDEVETTNPLGSKTGLHKLGAFYFVIKNFPPVINSALHNIHLLALANADDLKRHSVDPVMKVIIDELEHLHDEGFEFVMDGCQQNIRCLLTQLVGDNLGLHTVLGYMENFCRSTHACDLCMADQQQMQTVFKEEKLQMRSRELYNEQSRNLKSGTMSASECGIKRLSSLVDLPYYHPASNDAVDIMHELLEGVIPCEVKLFLRHMLYEVKPQPIALQQLNLRIKAFDYGRLNTRSKPSSILDSHVKSEDSSLGQRSAEMLTLFLFLPLLLVDVIPRLDPQKVYLLRLLKRVTDVVFAPCVSSSDVYYIRTK